MSTTPRILIFGGSLRRDSFNQKLAALAAEGAREAGAEVTVVALRDFPMPVFDADLEEADGKPEHARRLKELFASHHGLLIASPEYNSSITAALKNAIDWVSRADTDAEAPLSALSGKTAVICGTSPGALGGLRGLVHLRAILGNLGINVLPDQLAVPKAHEFFHANGTFSDEKKAQSVKHLGSVLAKHLTKMLA
jgi:NAD(P)H-dependent FMN reductase